MNFDLKPDEINYIKFFCKDCESNEIAFKAIVKSYNDRELFACAKNRHKINLILPQEVNLNFVYNDGLYSTTTVLKSTEDDDPYTFFIFETPKNISYKQNREYFRIPVKYNCTYKVIENNIINEYKAETFDISANGVSILLTNENIPNTFTEIVIFIDNKPIQVEINHIRTEKYNEKYKYSFAFTKISEKDRDFISQICFQKQLERKRNSLK